MSRLLKILLGIAISSLSAFFLTSVIIYLISKTNGIISNTQYLPIFLAIIGIIATIISSVKLHKSTYPKKNNAILSLIFFGLATVSATIFILLYYKGWYAYYWFEGKPNRLYKVHIAIAIIIPIIFCALSIMFAIFIKVSRRPTKAARLQAQVDDLQKQIDELKKGE